MSVGSRNVTYLPGPGGGLVYVTWDQAGVMGAAPGDITRAKDGARGTSRPAGAGRGRRANPATTDAPTIVSYTTTYQPWEEGEDEPESETEENEPVVIELDEVDVEDGLSLGAKAAQHIRQEAGLVEASSSSFHPGVWYTTADDEQNFRTGERKQTTFHLKNFSQADEQAVYEELVGPVKRGGRASNPVRAGRVNKKANQAAAEALQEVLARYGDEIGTPYPSPDAPGGMARRYRIMTNFGAYDAGVYSHGSQDGAAVMGRFDDPAQFKAAHERFGSNPYSGKWNHHYFIKDQNEMVQNIERALRAAGATPKHAAPAPRAKALKGGKGAAKVDFVVDRTGMGGIYTFTPKTPKAKAWAKQWVAGPEAQNGKPFYVDNQRDAEEIMHHAIGDGLSLTKPDGTGLVRSENPAHHATRGGRGGEQEVHAPMRELAREMTGKACYKRSCFTPVAPR